MRPIRALVVGAISVGLISGAQAQTVKLCHDDKESYPWLINGGQGLNNILVQMASTRSGVNVEMVALPLKRCLANVSDGLQDGFFASAYNSERAEIAVFPTTADGQLDLSRRMKLDGYSFFRLKGAAIAWDGKRLTGLTGPIGVQLGFSVGVDLKALGLPIEEAPGSAETQMRKLVAGRVKVVALLTLEGRARLHHPEFASQVEQIQPPFSEKPYFLIFGKSFYAKHRKTAESLWAGVAAARESEEFKTLRNAATQQAN